MPSLLSKVIRVAHDNPTLRPHLLPIIGKHARGVVQMTVAKDFYISTDLKRASRVGFMFAVSGSERQGTLYVNQNLSSPWEPDLAAHLSERWDRKVHPGEHEHDPNWEKSSFLKDPSFLRGALLRDALKAAQVVGKKAGASTVELRAIVPPTR